VYKGASWPWNPTHFLKSIRVLSTKSGETEVREFTCDVMKETCGKVLFYLTSMLEWGVDL
jgi:hypothetical protein